MPTSRTPRALLAAVIAGGLAACSEARIVARDAPIAAAAQPTITAIDERLAVVALDDSQLGGVRGGMSTGPGLVVNFSFQEATYVNHNLVQSIVVPTMTVSASQATAATATATAGGAVVGSVGNLVAQVPASAPALAIQSLLNSGLTSIVSRLGGGGITSTVSNAANNQLIQQVISANIGIAGLSQTLQQNVASTAASRLASANAQFR